MASRGDDFLKNLLGHDSSKTIQTASNTTGGAPPAPSDVPDHRQPKPDKHERHDKAESEIEEERRRAREEEEERTRPWWNIDPWGEPQGGKGGGSGPGGYKFDKEVIAQKITEWEDLEKNLQKDNERLQRAYESIRPPSADNPAYQQAEATKASIKAAVAHNENMRLYANVYIAQLRKANGTYVEREDQTHDTLSRGANKMDA